MADDKDQRTEKASPKKKEDARNKGNVAKSKDIPSVSVLLAALTVLFFASGYLMNHLMEMTHSFLFNAGSTQLSKINAYYLLLDTVRYLAIIVSPILLAVFCIAVGSNVIQTGFMFTTEPIAFKPERIDPLKGMKKLVSLNALVELFKSILKIVIISTVVYWAIKDELDYIQPLMRMAPGEIVSYIGSVSFSILFKSSWALLALALADFAYQKYEYEKGLRMTKQEVKDEMKQSEGDPKLKARVRALQREWAMQRMMEEVPKADVIITNPTHFAVALRYNSAEASAPVVLAKGRNHIAQRIKNIAIEHGVPIIEDKPLARAIFKTIDVGGEIPVKLYQAVAEVLAHVYRITGNRRR